MTTTDYNAANLVGQTIFIRHGSRYMTGLTVERIDATNDHGAAIWGTSEQFPNGLGVSAHWSEMHASEADARAAAKAARKPRTKRQPQGLYGDYAQLANFHGLRTDGTGRRA